MIGVRHPGPHLRVLRGLTNSYFQYHWLHEAYHTVNLMVGLLNAEHVSVPPSCDGHVTSQQDAYCAYGACHSVKQSTEKHTGHAPIDITTLHHGHM
jgi:hypothetical protein